MFFDITYLILLPALIFSLWAQLHIQRVYQEAGGIYARRGLTGAQAARMILDDAGLSHIAIESLPGAGLSDHYDPASGVLRLSAGNYSSTSVAALGVAAHEAGHAIQHQQGYAPMSWRSAILPLANIGSYASWPLLALGLILGSETLANCGVIVFGCVLAFQLVTLPVEFNASRRAMVILENENLLQPDELAAARKVLSAAAMTYVAALFTSLMQLLRLVMLAGRVSKRR